MCRVKTRHEQQLWNQDKKLTSNDQTGNNLTWDLKMGLFSIFNVDEEKFYHVTRSKYFTNEPAVIQHPAVAD